MKTVIIAEAGVNHDGDIGRAKELIQCAAAAGADYVKFQTFVTSLNIAINAPKARYQKDTTGDAESQYEMVKRLELTLDDHYALIKECQQNGIGFLSTGFDEKSVEFLGTVGLDYIKVPSGEITNYPLLRQIGQYGQPTIVSTGMATLGEIEGAIGVLEECGVPRRLMTILHCNTQYPTPIEDVNLNAMLSIGDAFRVQVGYSDHTLGTDIPIAAVALGATIIEKHFTLDRSLPGPDHAASLEPAELKRMVQSIRNVEAALGDGVKRPSPSEKENKSAARKSLVASRAIEPGESFTSDNVAAKRPGTGISPAEWDRVMGKQAPRKFRPDELIEL